MNDKKLFTSFLPIFPLCIPPSTMESLQNFVPSLTAASFSIRKDFSLIDSSLSSVSTRSLKHLICYRAFHLLILYSPKALALPSQGVTSVELKSELEGSFSHLQ